MICLFCIQQYFSLGSNGERNYLTSAAKFSSKNGALKWHQIPYSRFFLFLFSLINLLNLFLFKCNKVYYSSYRSLNSRFRKVAKVYLNSQDLNIRVKMRTPFLSTDVNYVVHLIFKFCDPRKSSERPSYVNLTYKIGSQTFHAYFAICRDEDWMKIELCRFMNNKEDTSFEVLLESFSQTYCGSGAIYVEGIEFQSIDNVSLWIFFSFHYVILLYLKSLKML